MCLNISLKTNLRRTRENMIKMILKVIFCLWILHGLMANGESDQGTASSFVTLQCPNGWKVQDQAWYVPKITTDTWHVDSWKTINSFPVSKSSTSTHPDFKVSMMCIICELDLTNFESTILKNRLEICSHSESFHHSDQKFEFEKQNCTAKNSLNWCGSEQPVCALHVPKDKSSLKTAIGNSIAVSYSDFFGKYPQAQLQNPYRHISMTCPAGSFIKGFEKHLVHCEKPNPSKQSFCILCGTSSIEFSVCLSKCAMIMPAAKINGLVVSSSNKSLEDKCGIRINAREAENLTLQSDLGTMTFSDANLIRCKEWTDAKANHDAFDHQSRDDSIASNLFNTVIVAFIFITFVLLAANILQGFMVKRLKSSERPVATEDKVEPKEEDNPEELNLKMDANPYYA